MVDYFYKEQAPLGKPLDPEIANYEDKIVLDEIKNKMAAQIDAARKLGINVKSEYHDPSDQELFNDIYATHNIPRGQITGRWYSDRAEGAVNVPQTPSLFNMFALGEELSHYKDLLPAPLEGQRAYNTAYRYEEEKRAKQDALNNMGGYMTPRVRQGARGTMDSYRDRMRDEVGAEQFMYDEGSMVGDVGDNALDILGLEKELTDAYNYWNQQGTQPIDFFNELYPELKIK